jgi:hypothetical protein
MGAQPGVQVAQAAGAPAQAAGAPVQAYVGEEQSIPMEFQRMGQVREELARLAGMYQRSGMGQQFMEVRAKILELDAGMTHLQGMQGLQELAMSNDPRRLAAVWSMYYGQPINIQPRSDGTYNVLVNGQLTDRGISATELSSRSRAAFDSAFRQQQSAATAEFNAKQFESRLKQQEDQSKLYGEMIKDIAVERTKGNLAQALEYVKANAGWEIKPVGSEGMVLIRPPGQSPFYFTPQGQTITIDGIEVQSNAARPIAGLPSYAPMG